MRTYQKLSLAKTIRMSSPKPIIDLSEDQIRRIKSYGEILLAVIALSTVFTVAAVMPGALATLKIFQKLKFRKRLDNNQKTLKITKTFYYLKRKGYIKTVWDNNRFIFIITKKGKRRINKLRYETLFIPRPKTWDGKFWQVAADIPTKYRNAADAFRSKIKKLGLFSLQRTLWFYPFDPRKEIEIVSKLHKIDLFVTVMRVDKLDAYDKRVIKNHFVKTGLI